MSSRSSKQTCRIAHCASCVTLMGTQRCRACRPGFLLDGLTGACTPCGHGCKGCDLAGPGHCDECLSGFTLVSDNGEKGGTESTSEVIVPDFDGSEVSTAGSGRHCEPCATHCTSCNAAGPGKCDSCSLGFMVDPSTEECAACSHGCSTCSSPDSSGCEACFSLFALSPASRGGGCIRAWWKVRDLHSCLLIIFRLILCFCVEQIFLVITSVVATISGLWRIMLVRGWDTCLLTIICGAFSLCGAGIFASAAKDVGVKSVIDVAIRSIIGIAFLGVSMTALKRAWQKGPSRPNVMVSHREFVNNGELVAAARAGSLIAGPIFPSGAWRGYYVQGRDDHGVAEFNLQFSADGEIQ